MAFNATNTGAYPGANNDTNVGGIGQPGYGNTGNTGLLGTEGRHHHHHDSNRGTGVAGEVCDPPHVYNAGPTADKQVRHVNDDNRERTFEAPRVEETVVHHEVERIRPVIHEEVHQTRLHERTHHKVEAPRDLGITEVVQHRDTDPCGNRITEDLSAVRGHGTGVKGLVENVKDKLTGRDEYNTAGVRNDKFAAGGVTPDIAPAAPATGLGTAGAYDNTAAGTGTGYGNTGAYDNTRGTATHAEPGGIKGAINKVIPGPGPFKA